MDSQREFPDCIKREAFRRAGGWCHGFGKMCDRQWATYNAVGVEYDHIKRWADGGLTTLENCQVLCTDCHTRKSSNESFVHALLRGAFTAPPGVAPTFGKPNEQRPTGPSFGSPTSFRLPD